MDIIKVLIEQREDGGLRVHSEDLPGLVLSGKNKTAVIADIEPAIKALREHKGKCQPFRVDAVFVNKLSVEGENGWDNHGRGPIGLRGTGV